MTSNNKSNVNILQNFSNKTLGIIGGGQLGKMIAISASRLGIKTNIYDPDKNAPAFQNANEVFCARYENKGQLKKFAESVDRITFEFENISLTSLEYINKKNIIFPGIKALKFSQDRYLEKNFISNLNIDLVPYLKIDNLKQLYEGLTLFNGNAILKTRRLGYDGKGQYIIKKNIFQNTNPEIKKNKYILESFIKFNKEISVIAIRSKSGKVVCYEPSINIHRNSILREAIYPADISNQCSMKAKKIAKKIAKSLNVIGIIAIEMFVCDDEKILVNEIAPSPHNSGHWTIDACNISQFEALVRTIFEMPIPKIKYFHKCKMINILGDNIGYINKVLNKPNYIVHLYGKSEIRPLRKLGHINIID